jgi:hypothetical protein
MAAGGSEMSIANPPLPPSITLDGVRKLNATIAAREQFLRQTIAGFERKYACSLSELNRRLEVHEMAEHPAWEDAIEWGNALDQLAQVQLNQSIVTWLTHLLTR